MNARTYVLGLALTTVAIIVTVAIGVACVDPYSIFQTPTLAGFNQKKPFEAGVSRVNKPLAMLRQHFDGIVFGSSLVEEGIDPEAASIKGRGVKLYNAGLSGMVPHEAAALLRYVAHVRTPSFAVVMLEFGRYESFRLEKSAANLSPDWNGFTLLDDVLHWTLSTRAIIDSVKTTQFNRTGDFAVQHFLNGRLNTREYFDAAKGYDYGYAFDYYDRNYIISFYDPFLSPASPLRRRGFDHAPLRAMLSVARLANIKLVLLIPPYHIRQSAIIYLLGLGQAFEQWESDIACIVDRFARDGAWAPDREPEVWDFSGLNLVTTEAVPGAGEKGTPLRYYFDPVHFRPAAGDALIATVLGLPNYASFGTKLYASTVSARIVAERTERVQYLHQHPEIRSKVIALGEPEKKLPLPAIEIPQSPGCPKIVNSTIESAPIR